MTFTADGSGLLSAGYKRGSGLGENELKFWDFATRKELRKTEPPFQPSMMSSSPSKTRVLLGSNGGGTVELHQAQLR